MATSYYQDTTLGKLRRAGGAIADIARRPRTVAEAAQRPAKLKAAVMPVLQDAVSATNAGKVISAIPTIAGAVSNAAQTVRAGGIMGAGTTNQPSAIQALRQQGAPQVAQSIAAAATPAPRPTYGPVNPAQVTGVPLTPPAVRPTYGPVDPSKVTGMPLGVDPSKVTGVPLPPPIPSIEGGNFAPPSDPNAPIAGYVAPTKGVATLQPDGTDAMGIFGGADVRRPDGTMRSFSPEDIARIAADPNAGRLQPPQAAPAPATIAEAMRGTGQNRFALDAQGQSVDPNVIANKEFAARTNSMASTVLDAQRESQNRLMNPRLTGRAGETLRIAEEGQKIQGAVGMAGVVAKSAESAADRQSKETIAAGQDKARVDSAKATASRPQDSAARAQMVKANAEAVAAAQAELDAAKADVGVWNSEADKTRVAAAEKRLADAVARQESESSMAGAATAKAPLAENQAEEGDEVVGPDGKRYVIRNGVPVPV